MYWKPIYTTRRYHPVQAPNTPSPHRRDTSYRHRAPPIHTASRRAPHKRVATPLSTPSAGSAFQPGASVMDDCLFCALCSDKTDNEPKIRPNYKYSFPRSFRIVNGDTATLAERNERARKPESVHSFLCYNVLMSTISYHLYVSLCRKNLRRPWG